ncbi:hypothetical protein F4780DRAFT_298579 [Xylariomycetidae sp. FL0641]|nr:hypothetical protein F4780DRAFT_298579 [Xylariomycetidae sp. FL0641]
MIFGRAILYCMVLKNPRSLNRYTTSCQILRPCGRMPGEYHGLRQFPGLPRLPFGTLLVNVIRVDSYAEPLRREASPPSPPSPRFWKEPSRNITAHGLLLLGLTANPPGTRLPVFPNRLKSRNRDLEQRGVIGTENEQNRNWASPRFLPELHYVRGLSSFERPPRVPGTTAMVLEPSVETHEKHPGSWYPSCPGSVSPVLGMR